MQTLRWALGAGAALVGVAFVAFFVLAERFRESFGASGNGTATLVVPLLVLGLVLASVVWPGSRGLLHLTAVAAVLALAGALWVSRAAPFLGAGGALYFGAWLLFYYLTLQAGRPAPP